MIRANRHTFFLVIVIFKILDGVLELLAGVLLYIFPKATFLHVLQIFFRHELLEDPHDVLFALGTHFFQQIALSTQHFIGVYMIFNGVLKVFLMSMVLQKKMWAYPLTAGVLSLLMVYEAYRFTYTHSPFLILFIGIDIAAVYLMVGEYRRMQSRVETTQNAISGNLE